RFAVGVTLRGRLTVELYGALARDNFHPLRFVGAEMEFAGINQAQRFLASIREKNGVTDDLAVEVNVSLGYRCDSAKFCRHRGHRPTSLWSGRKMSRAA